MTPEDFWKILHEIGEPPQAVYKLYYDDQGHPLEYTMDSLPGNFIEIDSETYRLAPRNVRVREGRLVNIPASHLSPKLKPSQNSGAFCHPQDICVIVPQHKPHRRWAKS